MADFPTNLDTIKKDWANTTPVKDTHPDEHNLVAEAVEALETKVGVDGSAVTTTHDFKLSNVADGDKAVSVQGTETITNKTLTTPTVIGGNFTSPEITSPTGIVKADVGLGNVNNVAQVNLTSAQTIAGVKTFTSSPIVPDPTTAQHPVTKAYFENNQATSLGTVYPYIGSIELLYGVSSDDLTIKIGATTNSTINLIIQTPTEVRTFVLTDFVAGFNEFSGVSVYNGDVYVMIQDGSPADARIYRVNDVLADLAGATITQIDTTTNSVIVAGTYSTLVDFCIDAYGVFYFSYGGGSSATQTVIRKSTLSGTTLGSPTNITLSGTVTAVTSLAVLRNGNIVINSGTGQYEMFNSSGTSQRYLQYAYSASNDYFFYYQDGAEDFLFLSSTKTSEIPARDITNL